MVDPREARRRAHGRTEKEQERADRHRDPAKTWGRRNPTAMSGNPQNPDAGHPERGDEGHRGTQGRGPRPHAAPEAEGRHDKEDTQDKGARTAGRSQRPRERPENMTKTDRASGDDAYQHTERRTER